MIDFFNYHKLQFTYLAMESEKRASYTLSETDCESFFDIPVYMLSPKGERIGLRKYKETAILSHKMQILYIDEDWVVKEYLRRVKEEECEKE